MTDEERREAIRAGFAAMGSNRSEKKLKALEGNREKATTEEAREKMRQSQRARREREREKREKEAGK